MIYFLSSFTLLLTGIHTKFIYYDGSNNRLNSINISDLGAIIVESIVLFTTIKVPFECLLNRHRLRPSPHTKRCNCKRVSLILIIAFNILSAIAIVYLQSLYYFRLSGIWILLFLMSCGFYFFVFETIMVGLPLIYE